MEPKFISGIENLNKVVYDNKEKIIMFVLFIAIIGFLIVLYFKE